MDYFPQLDAFERSVNELDEDIEFLREKGVNVDFYSFQNTCYGNQVKSLGRVLKTLKTRGASPDDPELIKYQKHLIDFQLGVSDLHRYMRLNYSEGDRTLPRRYLLERNPDTPMSSGYGSATSCSKTSAPARVVASNSSLVGPKAKRKRTSSKTRSNLQEHELEDIEEVVIE